MSYGENGIKNKGRLNTWQLCKGTKLNSTVNTKTAQYCYIAISFHVCNPFSQC